MRIQSLFSWTIIITMDYHSLCVRAATLLPSSIMECSSQTAHTQLIQHTTEACCLGHGLDTSTCIAGTFRIPPNQQRISLTWNATMRVPLTHGFRGIHLDVWRNELVSCPDTCFTITYTQNETYSSWDGAVSFTLNCYISQTGLGFGVDVLPVFNYSALMEELYCHELFKYPVQGDITVASFPETTLTRRLRNTTLQNPARDATGISTTKTMASSLTSQPVVEQWPTQSVDVVLLILAVLGSVSCLTVLIWCIVQVFKGRGQWSSQHTFNNNMREEVQEKDTQLTQCLESTNEVSKGGSAGEGIPHVLKDSLSSSFVISLPESFRSFIKNVNTES